jgi:Domain of unknown function (DUF4372)
MAHCNTVLSQLLKMVGRHGFEKIASAHHEGQKLRKTSPWSQFVVMAFAQLSGRQSLLEYRQLNESKVISAWTASILVTRM